MAEVQVPRGAVTIHLFPPDDLPLESAVRRTVSRVFDSGTPPEARLGVAVTRLREHYPDLLIRQRDALAEIVEETPVWYVYRDGSLLGRHVLEANLSGTSVGHARSAIRNVTRGRVECSVCGACRWSRSSDRVIAVWNEPSAVTDYVPGPDRGNTAWTCDQCGLLAGARVAALLSEVAPRAQV